MEEIKVIHVDWEGPYNSETIYELNDEGSDYGIYQIYGTHGIYGTDVLLYIGKADQQTFFTRLKQHKWVGFDPDAEGVKIYVGRLAGAKTPSSHDWSREIDLVEKLLIYSHSPAYNTQNLNSIPDEACKFIHVLNWGKHRELLPEVSGARYSSRFNYIDDYAIYGTHEEAEA